MTSIHSTRSLSDFQRIARSLKRTQLARRYSRGSFKHSSMAMINLYMRDNAYENPKLHIARRSISQKRDLHAVS